MWKRAVCIAVVAVLSPFLGCMTVLSGERQQEQKPTEKTEMEIRQVVMQASKALKNKDVERFMKVAAVPWFLDRVRVVQTEEELKNTFRKMFAEQNTDLRNVKFIIRQIIPYEKGRADFRPEHQKMLDRVMNKKDWFVRVEILLNNNNPEGFVLLVGPRKGKMKVLGLSD